MRQLKKELKTLGTVRVGRKSVQEKAYALATQWIEEIEPTLKNVFKMPQDSIQSTTENVTRLLKLSRPSNRVSSYVETIDTILKGYKNKFILPIQQINTSVKGIPQLHVSLGQLTDLDETNYIKEAIECAQSGFHRASIVLGWCAVIDRFQKKIQAIGFDTFNKASLHVKNQNSGKFKRWNKEFNISSFAELQTVFDDDLITVLTGGLSLLDVNEAERLQMLFGYRNQSAHPGNAPIAEPHLVAFFYDIIKIVFTNPKFTV